MAKIGILGTGRMGVRLAKAFAAVGHTVVLGSRDAARAREAVEAIKHNTVVAPVVLPAIFLRDGLVETLGTYAAELRGKLYVDITNPYNAVYSDFILP